MADNIYFERLELSDTFKEWRDKLNNLGTMIENTCSNVDNVTIFRNDNGEFEARDLLITSESGSIKASEYGQIGDAVYKNSTTDLNTLIVPGCYACDTAKGIDYNHPITVSTSSAIVVVRKRNTNIYQSWREMKSAIMFARFSSDSGASWSAWQPIGGKFSSSFRIYISKSGSDSNTGLASTAPVLTINRALQIAYSLHPTNAGGIVFFCIGEGNWGSVTFKDLPFPLHIYPYSGTAATEYSESLPTFSTLAAYGNSDITVYGVNADMIEANAGAYMVLSFYNRVGTIRARYRGLVYMIAENLNLEIKSIDSQEAALYCYNKGIILTNNTITINIIENITVTRAFVSAFVTNFSSLFRIRFTTNSDVTVTGKKYRFDNYAIVDATKTYLDNLPGNSAGSIDATCTIGGLPYGSGASDEALMADLSWKPVILQSGGRVSGNLAVGSLYCNRPDSSVTFGIGATWNDGASLSLYGKNTQSGVINGFELRSGQASYLLSGKDTGELTWTGTFTASTVFNAVWNDYAEFFPRGEETEPGDIIALDSNSEKEQYVKATKDSYLIVGAHSNTYAHLIGGEVPPEGEDFITYNLPKFIPVGLAGRINIKFKGQSKKGYPVTISDIPGVAELYSGSGHIIGYIVEDNDSNSEEIRLVKILIRHN